MQMVIVDNNFLWQQEIKYKKECGEFKAAQQLSKSLII